MKGKIKILDGNGHTTLAYDTEDAWSLEGAQQEIRDQLYNKNAVLFDGTTKEQIPGNAWKAEEHSETLVIPPMAGGA